MIALGQNYNLYRILLLIVGLWPSRQSKCIQFQFIFFSAILLTGIIFQLTPLITLNCTWNLVIKVLSSVFFFMIVIIEYNGFRLNNEVMKNLMMELQHILNKLRDKNEIAIIEKYSHSTKLYTVLFMTSGICSICSVIIVQIWFNVNNVDLQVNSSDPYYLIIMEYFIDQRKYFCLILLHINAVIYIGIITMLGISIMTITYFKHICGMLRIASYRIERAISIDILKNFTLKNKIWMIEGIICAVDTHRQAMKLCLNFLSTFEVTILMMVGCLVLCFSFNLFQTAVSTNNEFLLPAVYAVISLLYLFISSLVGQSITNNNNHIFDTVYNVQWYRAPLHIQKMLLFLLQRGSKEFTLNVCGVLDATIETFAMLMKASVSYFTVICSTRSI